MSLSVRGLWVDEARIIPWFSKDKEVPQVMLTAAQLLEHFHTKFCWQRVGVSTLELRLIALKLLSRRSFFAYTRSAPAYDFMPPFILQRMGLANVSAA